MASGTQHVFSPLAHVFGYEGCPDIRQFRINKTAQNERTSSTTSRLNPSAPAKCAASCTGNCQTHSEQSTTEGEEWAWNYCGDVGDSGDDRDDGGDRN